MARAGNPTHGAFSVPSLTGASGQLGERQEQLELLSVRRAAHTPIARRHDRDRDGASVVKIGPPAARVVHVLVGLWLHVTPGWLDMNGPAGWSRVGRRLWIDHGIQ